MDTSQPAAPSPDQAAAQRSAEETAVWEAMSTVIDPEVGIDVVDLGLVYVVEVRDGRARVLMTATTPACPLGPHMCESAEQAIRARLPALQEVKVELTWEPPWTPERMSPEARRKLGWGG